MASSSHDFENSVTGALMTGDIKRVVMDDSDSDDDHDTHITRTMSQVEQKIALSDPREVQALDEAIEATDRWHRKPVAEIFGEFGTDSAEAGLSAVRAADNLSHHGPNELEPDRPTPIPILFLMQFMNIIVVLLVMASVASIALGEWIEGVAILFIVNLNACIAVYTERSASNALDALSKLSQPSSMVVRDGVQQEVASRDVVPGDIVVLKSGDVSPADIRLVKSSDFKVNEMLLTGEPDDVAKNYLDSGEGSKKLTSPNMVFSACTVTNGTAVGVVVLTGMHTRVGSIARLLKGSGGSGGKEGGLCGTNIQSPFPKTKRTPLQKALHKLGMYMGLGALFVCTAVFVVGLVRGHRDPEHPDRAVWLQMVMVSVSLAVSAIPEGLPLCVTICLAKGTADMVKQHALVRKLPAVETLGSASVICTDKTGTLTEGKMTAQRLYCGGRMYDITGKGFQPDGEFLLDGDNVLEAGEGAGAAPDGACSDLSINAVLSLSLLCSDCLLMQTTDDGDETVIDTHDDGGQGGARKRKGNGKKKEKQKTRRERAEAEELQLANVGLAEARDRDLDTDGRKRQDRDLSGGVWTCVGNSSEAPLVVAAAKAGLWRSDLEDTFERVDDIPFSSSRKMMMTVVRVPSGAATRAKLLRDLGVPPSTKYLLCVKGAPNYILKVCAQQLADGGAGEPALSAMDEAGKQAVLEVVDDLSSMALRVLAMAYKPLDELPYVVDKTSSDDKFALLNCALTFGGLVASIDPERDGVKEAIQDARGANIRTVMITGDYLKTAVAIAKNIDLLKGGDVGDSAVDCEVLRPWGNEYLPEVDMDAITAHAVVFARARPEDKQEIVKSLQRQGFVSAMTGDGVNDAPSLKEADIGIAMGIAGTEVAKGASDMILTNDNFVSIVTAVEKGRVIYANIQKFVTFLLSTNIAEILLIFLSIVIGLPTPLQPLQILFVNLASDGAPALALSVEKGDGEEMQQRPRPKKQAIIHGTMFTQIIGHAISLCGMVMLVFALGLYWNTGHVLQDNIINGVVCGVTNFESTSSAYPTLPTPCSGFMFAGMENEPPATGYYNSSTPPNYSRDGFPQGDYTGDAEEDECAWVFVPDLNQWMWKCKGCYRYTGHETWEWQWEDCKKTGVARARTMAFITLTFAEVFRAYTVRSFRHAVWEKMFRNAMMQKAAALSISLTVAVVLIPGVNGVFGFESLLWFMWLLAIACSLFTVFSDETIKAIFRRREFVQRRWDGLQDGIRDIMAELKSLRSEISQVEYKLQVKAPDLPAHRRHSQADPLKANPSSRAEKHAHPSRERATSVLTHSATVPHSARDRKALTAIQGVGGNEVRVAGDGGMEMQVRGGRRSTEERRGLLAEAMGTSSTSLV